MHLCRAGLRVCLLDRATFPSDTPSTHGIQPSGVEALGRLGVLERLSKVSASVNHGRLAFDDMRVDIPDFTALLGAPMLNARRLVLDEILLEAAAAAGAEVRTGVAAKGLIKEGGRVAGIETSAGPVRAGLTIGADGARSTIARLVDARSYRETPGRRVFLWGYFEGVLEDESVWLGQVGDRGYLATPTDGGLFLAAVVEPLERLSRLRSEREQLHAEGIAAWPELADRLAGAQRVGALRAMGRWQGFFRRATGPGWALIGDAGHFKDPTPGQGIADALRQAETMAPAIAEAWGEARAVDAALRDWWRWRDRDAWEMYWFAQDMGSQELAPLLLGEFGAWLADNPEQAQEFLRVLNHEIPPSKFFTPRIMAPLVARAFASGRGRRRALARELRNLTVNEFRHRRPLRFPAKPRPSAG